MELAKLGVRADKNTVAKYMVKGGRSAPAATAVVDNVHPQPSRRGACVDFFTVPTVKFDVLYCSSSCRSSVDGSYTST
jgi:hypothetical protein